MKEHMFWGLVVSLAVYFFFTYQRLERIATDIKVIRATYTQQSLPVKDKTLTLQNR